jgi:hypothetical protein
MFKVMSKPCDQCLLSNNKVVSDKRRDELLEGITSEQGYFECHKASIAGTDHCCRNFYDKLGHTSQSIRIAQRLNMVEFSIPQLKSGAE